MTDHLKVLCRLMTLKNKQLVFQQTVLQYFHDNKRDLPWRQFTENGELDPYSVLVSEFMLQQTQVSRVVAKYHEFLRCFPTVFKLADATLADVLKVWSGLGYNRRAKFLHETAREIVNKHAGKVPDSFTDLTALPGIGANTAAAILVYSFNVPLVFIETNIRTVYLHHFFTEELNVDDSKLMPFIEQTLDTKDPRRWYWALMDYGTYIKSTHKNPNIRSKHYVKQSTFSGSRRYVRGQIIKLLTQQNITLFDMQSHIKDDRLEDVLADLLDEGFVTLQSSVYSLKK